MVLQLSTRNLKLTKNEKKIAIKSLLMFLKKIEKKRYLKRYKFN